MKNKIRALAMDVDGTLTDGSLYLGPDGELFKKFNVKDGYAICDLLPKGEIIPIVITGRKSKIVSNRCKELKIQYIIQGSTNKLRDLAEVLEKEKISFEETAYIGDDLNDIGCFQKVAVRGCPSDAVEDIKEVSDFVSQFSGGNGAVREFIEWLLCKNGVAYE